MAGSYILYRKQSIRGAVAYWLRCLSNILGIMGSNPTRVTTISWENLLHNWAKTKQSILAQRDFNQIIDDVKNFEKKSNLTLSCTIQILVFIFLINRLLTCQQCIFLYLSSALNFTTVSGVIKIEFNQKYLSYKLQFKLHWTMSIYIFIDKIKEISQWKKDREWKPYVIHSTCLRAVF